MLFPLSQETSQVACCCSLGPYWGMLGLARPDQRAENRCSSERRRGSGKGSQNTENCRGPEATGGLRWSLILFCVCPLGHDTHWARESRGRKTHAVKLASLWLHRAWWMGFGISPVPAHPLWGTLESGGIFPSRCVCGATVTVTSIALRLAAPVARALRGQGVTRPR